MPALVCTLQSSLGEILNWPLYSEGRLRPREGLDTPGGQHVGFIRELTYEACLRLQDVDHCTHPPESHQLYRGLHWVLTYTVQKVSVIHYPLKAVFLKWRPPSWRSSGQNIHPEDRAGGMSLWLPWPSSHVLWWPPPAAGLYDYSGEPDVLLAHSLMDLYVEGLTQCLMCSCCVI